MRLIHTEALQIESFTGSVPSYAILSHTWGYEEVLFEDLHGGSLEVAQAKYGFAKLKDSCSQARKDGYDYIWIDTCCIDKSSSAELSEAINSMFKWYRAAQVCYAYLSDVSVNNSVWDFERSKWFSRGWTLQELIAPDQVEFYDQAWNKIGERNSMAALLARITSIDKQVLSRGGSGDCAHFMILTSDISRTCLDCGANLSIEGILASYSIATRLGWAASRVTTREEDIAYCLLGILDVNLPLLYGEGKKAFIRLQEELIRTSSDQSILAYSEPGYTSTSTWVDPSGPSLATSPAQFRLPYQIEAGDGNFAISISNQGVTVDLLMCPCILRDEKDPEPATPRSDVGFRDWLGVLDCSVDGSLLSRPALLLETTSIGQNTFQRVKGNAVVKLMPHNIAANGAGGKITAWHGFTPRMSKDPSLLPASNSNALMTESLSSSISIRNLQSEKPFVYGPATSLMIAKCRLFCALYRRIREATATACLPPTRHSRLTTLENPRWAGENT
ncbi:HET-domain-containing protein [Thozetella sp. PMI_491]|nr:HET-domain-containing protein [Thozetella sp. PMI_491]